MYGPDHKYYEDVAEGDTWVSPPRVLTQDDIQTFADLTGDFNPMHVNPEYAATMPFGRTIAHGLLTLARASGSSIDHPPMRTLAIVELRSVIFRAPVFPGDELHVRTTVAGKERKGRGKRGLITWKREAINQEGKVVQEGTSVTLVEAREPPPPRLSD
ncbi:MAG: MaoC family dehydratase [Gemmataceae bacterium]|nr:MaoC family dehydratase [Gemmataceae bacterium]